MGCGVLGVVDLYKISETVCIDKLNV
ncbi:protein of unknown function (plasmid) [Caballeronia sp. S22]